MAKISVIINTYNEEKYLNECLKHLQWADEIVIIDMYSTDNTLRIAKKFTSKIYFHKRTRSVLYARNFSLTKTTGDWVLIIDPDEIVPETLAYKLREISINNSEIVAVNIPRRMFWLKKELKYAYPITHTIRFFKKGVANFPPREHSNPIINGNILTLPTDEKYIIKHYTADTLSRFLKKTFRYTAEEAKDKFFTDGVRFSLFKLIKAPIAEFYYRFFVRKGVKDGFRGIIFCFCMSFYHFLIWLKLLFIQYNLKIK